MPQYTAVIQTEQPNGSWEFTSHQVIDTAREDWNVYDDQDPTQAAQALARDIYNTDAVTATVPFQVLVFIGRHQEGVPAAICDGTYGPTPVDIDSLLEFTPSGLSSDLTLARKGNLGDVEDGVPGRALLHAQLFTDSIRAGKRSGYTSVETSDGHVSRSTADVRIRAQVPGLQSVEINAVLSVTRSPSGRYDVKGESAVMIWRTPEGDRAHSGRVIAAAAAVILMEWVGKDGLRRLAAGELVEARAHNS